MAFLWIKYFLMIDIKYYIVIVTLRLFTITICIRYKKHLRYLYTTFGFYNKNWKL